jgi:hypothetical protein
MVRPANPINNHPSLSTAARAPTVAATAVLEAQAAIATTPLHLFQKAWGNKDVGTLNRFKSSAWLHETPLPKIVQGVFQGLQNMPREKGPTLNRAALPTSYPEVLIKAEEPIRIMGFRRFLS